MEEMKAGQVLRISDSTTEAEKIQAVDFALGWEILHKVFLKSSETHM